MSMYYGVLLTPVEPNLAPDANKLVRFLNWLIETGDITLPTTDTPINVSYSLGENDNLEEKEFFSINGKLEAFLRTAKTWTIFLDIKNGIGKGVFSSLWLFESLQLSRDNVNQENSNIGSSSLCSITIRCGKIFGQFGRANEINFAISLVGELSLDEAGTQYFQQVWPNFSASHVVARLEDIFDIQLQPTSHFI